MTSPKDPHSPDNTFDPELEAFLSRRSAVSQRYRALGNEPPPPELDNAILARAREAAASQASGKIARLPHRKLVRWIAPFALAASLLLTFTVIHQTGLEPVTTQHWQAETAAPQVQPAGSALEAPVTAPVPSASTPKSAANVIVDPPPAEVPRAINAPLKTQSPQPLFKMRAERSAQETSASAADAAHREAVAAVSNVTPAAPPPPQITVESKKDASVARIREPKTWLDDIRKLRVAGKPVEAETELKLFLEAYPDYFDKHPDIARP